MSTSYFPGRAAGLLGWVGLITGLSLRPLAAQTSWPLPPVIVPPVMVRDFNFSALADAI
jgi:hypothetical protein